MIELAWSGKAVTKNNKHTVRKGRDGKRYIMLTRRYREFVEELAYTFRSQCRSRFAEMDVSIAVSVSRRTDHHNLIEPICDALETAGIIDDDRHIGEMVVSKPERHKRGEPDEIRIILTNCREAGR